MPQKSQVEFDAAVSVMQSRHGDVRKAIEDMRRKIGDGKRIDYEDLRRLEIANDLVWESYGDLGSDVVVKSAAPRPVRVQTFEGQTVEVLRPAIETDAGYDLTKAPQEIVRLPDGTEKIVPMSEVMTVSE